MLDYMSKNSHVNQDNLEKIITKYRLKKYNVLEKETTSKPLKKFKYEK